MEKHIGCMIILSFLLIAQGVAQEPPTVRKPMRPNPEYLLLNHGFLGGKIVPQKIITPRSGGALLGFGVTGTAYYGDLNYAERGMLHATHMSFHPGLEIFLRNDASKYVVPVFHLGYGNMLGQSSRGEAVTYTVGGEEMLIQPNTFAESILIYGDVGINFSPFPRVLKLRPYVEAGIGGMAYYPRAEDGVLLFRKRSTRLPGEEYGTLAAYFPLSAGASYRMSQHLQLDFAYIRRFNSTDYLDNIGKIGRHAGNDQLHTFRLGVGLRVAGRSK